MALMSIKPLAGNMDQFCFYTGLERYRPMKCTNCSRPLVFSSRSDRGSGLQVDTYRCTYCGCEMREYRPNRQMGR